MSCGGFFIELMLRHRIEMCDADARKIARRTFDALRLDEKILRSAQNGGDN